MVEDNEERLLRSVALKNAESIRSARQRAEQQAEATLREQANLLNLTHDAIYVRDPDGVLKYWNRGAEQLYGWTAEEALGKAVRDLLRTIFPVPFEQIQAEMVRAGRWEGDLVHTKKDGTSVVVASRWSLQRDERGAPLAILVTNNDITERKRAEQARQEIEEQWRAAFESNPTMYFIVDADGTTVSVNASGAEQLGYSENELIGQPVLNVFYQPDRRAVRTQVEACFEQPGQLLAWEARKTRKDGTIIWVREKAKVVLLKKRPVMLVVCEEITEQKRAEEAARRSEKELHDVLKTIPAVAFSSWPDGTKDWVNRRWVEYSGLSAEASRSTWQSTLHPDDRDGYMDKWRTCLVSGDPFESEARHRGANGKYRWFLVRAVPLRDEQGQILKWYGTLTDIEDRKRAERLLAGEKRILEMVAKGDSLPQILDTLCRLVEEQASDLLASILLVDGNCLRHGGAPSLPKAYTDAIDGAAIGPCAGSCGTAAYRGEQIIVEDISTDPLWAEYRGLALPYSLRACWSTPVFSSQGKVIATFAMYYGEPRSPSLGDQEIIEQITHLAGVAIERKLTQEKLRRSEAYLAEAQRVTHTGSWAFSPAVGKIIYWSEEMFRIWGFDSQHGPPDPEALLLRIHSEDLNWVRERQSGVLGGTLKGDLVFDFRIALPDGTVKYINTSHHSVLDEAGKVVEYVGTSVDVTGRKRAEEALRAAETRFRTYVDHATDALFVHDEQGRIVDVNRQACESLGYARAELIGMEPRRFDVGVDTAFMQSVSERFDAGEIFAFEASHRRRDGTTFPVEVRVRPFSHGGHKFSLALARDITDRKRAEQEKERLRHLEAELTHINRVSTMGELTASLAHEVNQPIAAAVTNASTCVRWLAGEVPNIEEARDAAKRTVKDAKRAAEIVGRIRLLFKKSAPQRELIDLNEVVSEMIALLRGDANRQGVSIRTELAPDLPQVAVDRVQLQQVLMNLMINGIEAMKDVDRRELTLASRRDGQKEVRVSVSDSGVGLPPEGEEIFHAFFTTKPDGTGLGLAISRSITESHGGRLWASSNSGGGATFHLALPTTVEAHL
jgi:PAS domain S-box-containing protein